MMALLAAAGILAACRAVPFSGDTVADDFAGRDGALIIMECSDQAVVYDFRPLASEEQLPPCSTFKIWNTLLALEEGIVAGPETPFYQWDGKVRSISGWNRNLTLREAFHASCVPAFQALTQRIGQERMQRWIDSIGYGDRNISAGVDCFWLPASGRNTIRITPREQALLLSKLISGRLPASEKAIAELKRIMKTQETANGVLYGKTGSGTDASGAYNLGWYVGFAESEGRTYAFACTLKGRNATGRDARAMVEKTLARNGIL